MTNGDSLGKNLNRRMASRSRSFNTERRLIRWFNSQTEYALISLRIVWPIDTIIMVQALTPN